MASSSNSTANSLPPYITKSPVGFHVLDLRPFLLAHPTPLSNDPTRREFASESAQRQISQMFPHTPSGIASCNLFVYNKTRDVDRICPSCRRFYRVGEPPGEWGSLDAFLARKTEPLQKEGEGGGDGDTRVQEEQELSGICSGLCFDLMTLSEEEEWSEEKTRAYIKRHARDGLPPKDKLAADRWELRKTSTKEEAESGMKIIWQKDLGGLAN